MPDQVGDPLSGRTAATPEQPPAVPIPIEILNVMRKLAGAWQASGRGPGGTIAARWEAELSTAQHCLLLHYEGTHGDEPFVGQGILGWNSSQRHLQYVMFYCNDVIECADLAPVDTGDYRGRYHGQAKGTPFEAEAAMRFELPNSFVFSTSPIGESLLDPGRLGARIEFARSSQPSTTR